MPANQPSSFRIFISYSHEDEELLARLRQHLSGLEYSGLVRTFYDGKLRPGTNWDRKIRAELKDADLILLLVSPGFLGSGYVNGVELRQALERHDAGDTLVIPIAIRPCYWGGTPISELQALPRSGVPVTKWEDRDVAFQQIVHAIHDELRQLAEKEGQGSAGLAMQKLTDVSREPSPLSSRQQAYDVHDPALVTNAPTDQIDKLGLLADIDLFRNLRRDEFDRLAQIATWRHVVAHTVLFSKGDPGDSMMMVVRGRVKVYALSDEGQEIVLTVFRPGEVFGEIALLDGSDRSANAIALEDSDLLIVRRRDFTSFLLECPDVGLQLIETLSRRLRRVTQLLESLAFKEGPERLALRLVILAETIGVAVEGGIRIDLAFSQDQLAMMDGVSREAENKCLKHWRDDGLIEWDSGYYTITDLDRLRERSKSK